MRWLITALVVIAHLVRKRPLVEFTPDFDMGPMEVNFLDGTTVDLRPRSTGTCAQCGAETGSDAVSFCCYDHQRAWHDQRRGAA